MPRLLPYCRQSLARPGETAQTSLSLDAQESVIRDWGEANGYDVLPAVRDHDLKGDDPDRPGLAAVAERAKAGDVVAVYKWDRLARDVELQERFVRRLDRAGVAVVSVTEPSTRLTRVIYGAVNEEFRAALSERMRAIKRAQAQRGHYLGSACPYGYRRASTAVRMAQDGTLREHPSGPLIPNPATAPIVAEIYERIAAGEPAFAIAVDLDRRGVPTANGGRWAQITVREIVRSPLNAGDVPYRGEIVARDAHPPIVDRDLWQRAVAVLDRTAARRHVTANTLSSWAEGLIEHACGARAYLVPTQGKRRQDGTRTLYPQFGCRNLYRASGRCPVRPALVAVGKIEAAIRRALAQDLAAVVTLDDAIAAARAAAGGRDADRQRRALDDRRATAIRRHARARERWLAGREPIAWMDAEDDRLAADLAGIEAEAARLPAAPDPARLAAAAATLGTFAAAVAAADDAALRRLLLEVGTAVYGPDGLAIRYHADYAALVQGRAVEV